MRIPLSKWGIDFCQHRRNPSERSLYSDAAQTPVKRPRGFQLPINPVPPPRSVSDQTHHDFDSTNAVAERLPNVCASLTLNWLSCGFLIKVERNLRVINHEAKPGNSPEVFSVKGQEYRARRRVTSGLAPVRGQQLGQRLEATVTEQTAQRHVGTRLKVNAVLTLDGADQRVSPFALEHSAQQWDEA